MWSHCHHRSRLRFVPVVTMVWVVCEFVFLHRFRFLFFFWRVAHTSILVLVLLGFFLLYNTLLFTLLLLLVCFCCSLVCVMCVCVGRTFSVLCRIRKSVGHGHGGILQRSTTTIPLCGHGTVGGTQPFATKLSLCR